MMEFLGWAALLVVGGWGIYSITFIFILFLRKGGLGNIPSALFAAACATIAWAAFIVWLSPVTISVGVSQ